MRYAIEHNCQRAPACDDLVRKLRVQFDIGDPGRNLPTAGIKRVSILADDNVAIRIVIKLHEGLRRRAMLTAQDGADVDLPDTHFRRRCSDFQFCGQYVISAVERIPGCWRRAVRCRFL